MAYILPSKVVSPQTSVSHLRPIIDRGEDNWSAALLNWDGELAVGLRWNSGDSTGKLHPGNPQSRGLPTWFIVPNEIATGVLHALVQCGLGGKPDGEPIDVDKARQWVDEALQKLESTDTWSEEFTRRVKEIVKTMREAGEI